MTSRQMAHMMSCSVPLVLCSMAAEPAERGQTCLTEMAADVGQPPDQQAGDRRDCQADKRATAEIARPIIVIPTSGRPLNLKLHR